MYLYNVSLIIEDGQETNVTEVIQQFTGKDTDPQIRVLKMLDAQHEGTTYCLQIDAPDRQAVRNFQQGPLAQLQTLLEKVTPGKVLYFDSVMEYL